MPLRKALFDLPKEAFSGLAHLITRFETVPELQKCVQEFGPAADWDIVAQNFSQRTGIEEADAGEILSTLLNLNEIRSHLELTPHEFVVALGEAIERRASEEWKEKHLASWQRIAALVEKELHPDNAIGLSAKSVELTYAHQNILRDARIFTDLRPVFNQAGDRICGAVITHRLTLNYHDGHANTKIQLTIDAKDVTELRELCKRAEKKAQVLRESLQGLPWKTTIVGASDRGKS